MGQFNWLQAPHLVWNGIWFWWLVSVFITSFFSVVAVAPMLTNATSGTSTSCINLEVLYNVRLYLTHCLSSRCLPLLLRPADFDLTSAPNGPPPPTHLYLPLLPAPSLQRKWGGTNPLARLSAGVRWQGGLLSAVRAWAVWLCCLSPIPWLDWTFLRWIWPMGYRLLTSDLMSVFLSYCLISRVIKRTKLKDKQGVWLAVFSVLTWKDVSAVLTS